MTCECGCGYAGPDPVADFLIAEAMDFHLDMLDAVERQKAAQKAAVKDAERRASEQLEKRRREEARRGR